MAAAAMAELPEELIVEILPWLPVKSLKRFRSLSKPLCSLIDSPHFVKLHLSKSSQNSNLRKLIFQDPSRKKFHACNLNLDQEEEVLRLENPVSSPWKLVYGYCQGLLLLYRGRFKFSVWNPSTRQSRNLPEIPLRAPSNNLIYTIIGSGLGYDDSINDLKAFSIVHVRRNGDSKFDIPKFEVEVWICGLKANTWRKSQNWNFSYLLFIEMLADYVLPGIGSFIPTDGVIYWVCTVMSYRHEIVAFDVKKETYSILPPPDCLHFSDSVKRDINHPLSTALHVLEGCLCISYVKTMPLQADFYIRRKDEGDQFAWTQLFLVTEPLFVDKVWFKTLQVLGYLKRGDKIMLDLGMDYMVSFDLKEKTFGKVEMDNDSNWKVPIPCIESLVPLS